MKTLTNTGRILYGIPFILFGIMHFMKASMMAGLIPAIIPGKMLWVYLIGAALMAAGISIVLKKYIRITGLLLAALLMMFIFVVHIPSIMSGDPMRMQMSMPNMIKDMALMGAALYMSGTNS